MAIVDAPTAGLAIFERLASNPDMDVTKLERLMGMYTEAQARSAREQFFAAFARMQAELPAVERKGKGHNNIRYAKNDDIQEAVRPVLERHGFSLSFRTEFPTPKSVKITAVLAHAGGHDERTEFVSDADTSGNKNAIQAMGSTIAYGKRYATGAILNITTKDEVDTDGETQPEAPKGYEDAITDLAAATDEGPTQFASAFRALPEAVRLYATKHDRAKLEGLKAKAKQKAVKQ